MDTFTYFSFSFDREGVFPNDERKQHSVSLHAFHERYTRIFATDHDTGLSRDTQCLAVSRSNVSINTRGNFLAVSRLDIEHRA